MAFRLAQLDVPAALAYGQSEAAKLREQAPSAFGSAAGTAVKPTRFAGQMLSGASSQAGLMGDFGRQARGEINENDVQMFKDWIGRYRAGGLDPMTQQQPPSEETA